MSTTAYWDNATQQMLTRDCTPEEEADIAARQAQAVANAPAQAAAAALLADANTEIKSDTRIATWKGKNWAAFSADFDALTQAEKLEVLKRAAFATLKRVV